MSVAIAGGPTTYRFGRDHFYRMVDQGMFDGVCVELIDGEVLEMASQSNLHALSIKLAEDALEAAFGSACWVRVQMPLDISARSAPNPDLAVIAGDPRSHNTRDNPRTALLVVEVSDTSLAYDRYHKSNLYASAGIADYWIINLVDRQVEVLRNPVADPAAEYGHRFASRTVLAPTEAAEPLVLPGATIPVADVLP